MVIVFLHFVFVKLCKSVSNFEVFLCKRLNFKKAIVIVVNISYNNSVSKKCRILWSDTKNGGFQNYI